MTWACDFELRGLLVIGVGHCGAHGMWGGDGFLGTYCCTFLGNLSGEMENIGLGFSKYHICKKKKKKHIGSHLGL